MSGSPSTGGGRDRGRWLRRLFAPAPLRPPGALSEAAFAARCIRCTRCIEVCPYDSLRPAGWAHGPDAGTPLVEPERVPCYLCMECPPVCPTGALEPTEDKRAVRMGTAVVDEEACWAFRGILCRTCIDECPFGGGPLERVSAQGRSAIYQDGMLRPVVTDACVGCGICERFCPGKDGAGRPAIRVRPAGPPREAA